MTTGSTLLGLFRRARQRKLVTRLRHHGTRGQALEDLLRGLSPANATGGPARYAMELIVAVDSLSRAGLHEELLDLLDAARFDSVNERGRRYLAVYGALAHLHLGQAAEARNVLDGIDGALDGEWEEWRLAIDALAAAAVGRRREAKALASWIEGDRYALEREVATAHALAAEGRRAEAQAVLLRVQEQYDDPRLESLQLFSGPATPLANAVIAKKGSPFR